MLNFNNNISKGLICLLAGATLPLAFAPFGYFIITIICLALLFNCWINDKPLIAFRNGYLFGLGLFGTGVSWLRISINLFGGVNLFGSIVITFILVAFLALFPAITAYLGRRFFSEAEKLFLFVAIPALWVCSEWCRAWIFTGFPWLQLGYSQSDSPLNSLFPLFGVYGVGFFVVLSSSLLVSIFRHKPGSKIISLLILSLLWLAPGLFFNKDWTQIKRDHVSVALIQGAVPQEDKWKPGVRQPSLDLYLNLSKPYLGSELIVWPETAIPAFQNQVSSFMNNLHKLARQHGTNLLIGMPTRDAGTREYYNSVVLLNEDISQYNKKHLVPFGEYLPLKLLLEPITRFLDIPMSDFSAGTQESSILHTPNFSAGISICYEDTFGNEVNRALPQADILVNVSNDAWFGDSIAPHQHLQMARMRALETGRYMLRATNTGITAIINEKGKIIKQSEQFVPAALAANIALYQGITPYSRFGDMPIIIICLTLLGICKRKYILTVLK